MQYDPHMPTGQKRSPQTKDRKVIASELKTARPTKGKNDPRRIAIQEALLPLLASHNSIFKACEALPPDMKVSPDTVLHWVYNDQKGFGRDYAEARDISYKVMADELIAIADDRSQDFIPDADGNLVPAHVNVARAQLQISTRKWLLERVLPRLYGAQLNVVVSQGISVAEALMAARERATVIEGVQFTEIEDAQPKPEKISNRPVGATANVNQLLAMR